MAPDSELLAPPLVPVPFLQTLCLHPHLSPSVRLAWHRLEKSEGWAFCTFGSRLILVSWLYLFSILLPLYSGNTSTAWLILNRPPDLSTAVSNFRASFGKGWKEGGEREGGKWRSSLPGAVLAVTQSYSALQVNTGRTRVRAEPRPTNALSSLGLLHLAGRLMPRPHGQDHWPASYPECGSNAQSPINIQTDSVTFDPDLLPLQPHGYEQPGTEPLNLHNNGHTVQLSLPSTLYLEGLPRKYVAAQLHLHWGQKGTPWGSEHLINGKATAAELHIVHYDSESYESLSEAAQRPQGLAVLGILIEVGETKNPAYEHILSHLHEIKYKDQKTSMPPFNVRGLLPPLLAQYFRYNGSLTTPPCYQSVLWTVFHRRAQISTEQLEKLRETLFSTEEEPSEPLVQNYRAPQPLNQRMVFASFIQGEMLSLGVGILVGCLCLLLAVYFIARKIRRKRLRNRKSVVFTSARATEA
uniref:carbonic anhydrase n=1 Tax=Bos indicus x Bos taurus TaxID=30522 RepID=A0A4W2GVE8_BOBOX